MLFVFIELQPFWCGFHYFFSSAQSSKLGQTDFFSLKNSPRTVEDFRSQSENTEKSSSFHLTWRVFVFVPFGVHASELRSVAKVAGSAGAPSGQEGVGLSSWDRIFCFRFVPKQFTVGFSLRKKNWPRYALAASPELVRHASACVCLESAFALAASPSLVRACPP